MWKDVGMCGMERCEEGMWPGHTPSGIIIVYERSRVAHCKNDRSCVGNLKARCWLADPEFLCFFHWRIIKCLRSLIRTLVVKF